MEVADESNFTYPKLSISYQVRGELERTFRSKAFYYFIDPLLGIKSRLHLEKGSRKVEEIVEIIHLSIKEGQPIFRR